MQAATTLQKEATLESGTIFQSEQQQALVCDKMQKITRVALYKDKITGRGMVNKPLQKPKSYSAVNHLAVSSSTHSV